MAQYKVLERTYVSGERIYEEGEVLEFSGTPGSNLQPIDDDAKKAAKAAPKADPAPDAAL